MTDQEAALLDNCNSLDELKRRFIAAFGSPTDENVLDYSTRITSIWYNRVKIKERFKKKRECNAGAIDNALLVPRTIRHKHPSDSRAEPFGTDDMPVKIHNVLAEIIQFHASESKVQIEIRDELRRGNDLMTAQTALFEKLAKHGDRSVDQ